ncbi:MAG: hypothetical protein LUD07_10285 [Clostridiales bacterium]|nr:hypothetical protein [Clostridiales bacterium]
MKKAKALMLVLMTVAAVLALTACSRRKSSDGSDASTSGAIESTTGGTSDSDSGNTAGGTSESDSSGITGGSDSGTGMNGEGTNGGNSGSSNTGENNTDTESGGVIDGLIDDAETAVDDLADETTVAD